MKEKDGDNVIPVPYYVDLNVSNKVVKIAQYYADVRDFYLNFDYETIFE